MLPPNTASWHSKYHKLKDSENSRSRKITLISFLVLLPLKQVIKSFCERSLPIPLGNKHLFLQRGKHTENVNKQALPSFSQFTVLPSDSLTCHIPHNYPLFIQPTVKILFLWVFIFLSRLPCA